jgi:hypothetical protein
VQRYCCSNSTAAAKPDVVVKRIPHHYVHATTAATAASKAALQANNCAAAAAAAAVAHLSMRFASTAFSKQPAIFLIAIFSLVSRLRAELHEHMNQPVAPQ